MRVRLVVSSLIAGALAISPAGHAAPAPKPQVTDAKGDALGAQAALDIVSGTFATTGVNTVRTVKGKKITTYTPQKFVATLELAGPPSSQAGAVYTFDAVAAGCGYFNLSYTPGAALGEGSLFTECGSPEDATTGTSTLFDVTPKVEGNKIVWTMSLKMLPKEIKIGTTFSDFVARTDINEPVFGLLGTSLVTAGGIDIAEGAVSWKLG